MDEKIPIPAAAFDPSRHVLHGRDAKTGVQKWFALADIVAAEKTIETIADPASPIADVTKADLQALEQRVSAALANVPPAQFPADLMETFATMTQTVVSLAKRVEKLEADNEVWHHNAAEFKALTGVGR